MDPGRLAKVFGPDCSHFTIPALDECAAARIKSLQCDLGKLQKHRMDRRLTHWKTQMNDPSFKNLGRWIRARETSAEPL